MQKENRDIAEQGKEAYTEDEMAHGVPILSDIVFKYIFGTEESTDILKTFINVVLQDADFPEIASVSVINPFNAKTYIDEKYSVIDTRAEDEKGNKYNVEVQVRTQADYKERSLYYWAKSYSDQLKNGNLYGELKKVISISILNFQLFPAHIPCHSCFMLRENNNPGDILTEDCSMHYLEVPKLEGRPHSEIEKWLYFIEHGDEEDETVRVLLTENTMMQAAKKRYDYFVADERARIAYQQRSMFLHDQANYIYTARKEGLNEGRKAGLQIGLQQGLQEGIEQGIEQGIKQGIEQGIEKGRFEEKQAVARSMKEAGIPIDKIAAVTGFTVEKIQKL